MKNAKEINEGSGLAESVTLEVHDRDTGRLKQRTTIKDGMQTDEIYDAGAETPRIVRTEAR
jgi:hypothetical protein